MNSWVYDTVNNGVYKIGFATSQAAYNEHITKLFQSLDRLEAHLSEPGHRPYLFGEHVTEADVRLYTTLIRFDVAYYALFKCNIKMIRMDYPRLHEWLRRLYWDEGLETAGGVFKKTTQFEVVSRVYLLEDQRLTGADQTRVCRCDCGKWRCACGPFALHHAPITDNETYTSVDTSSYSQTLMTSLMPSFLKSC